ncbi:MAG: hypothetical protein JWM19_1978 [Actinomycetia bacterium]|nr:hypothetical protein [Actinomycetes bacterium]
MLVARLYGTGDIRVGEEEPPAVKGVAYAGEPQSVTMPNSWMRR